LRSGTSTTLLNDIAGAGDLSQLLGPDPGSAGPLGYRREVRQPVSPGVLGLTSTWLIGHWGGLP
jgi:hypothetical protein